MTTQTGFLLSSLKYGDSDGILHCFTEEKGFQTFFVRGLYASKSKKKAYIQPMNELCLTIGTQSKSSGKIPNVSKIEPVENPDFYTDIKCINISFFIADFLNIILKNENRQPEIYEEILFFLNELEQNNYQSHIIFLLKILKIQGLSPLISEAYYLDAETGEFGFKQTHRLFTEEISSVWKLLLQAENPYNVRVNQELRRNLLESILVYYHYHYPDFRTPHSLDVLKEIFS